MRPILFGYTGARAQCPCSDLIERVRALETSEAVTTTTQVGAEATQAGRMTAKAVTPAGTWTTMASGFAGLVVGILSGLIIVKS